MDKRYIDLPARIELILLFILGCPGKIHEKTLSDMKSERPCTQIKLDQCSTTTEVLKLDESAYVSMNIEGSDKGGFLLHLLEFDLEIAPQDIRVQIGIFGNQHSAEKAVRIGIVPGDGISESVITWTGKIGLIQPWDS